MAWTTDDLVAAIKRRAQIPDANGSLTDADILELADEELQTTLVPMLTTAVEYYFVKQTDFALVANQSHYRIPPQVQAGTLTDVVLLDQNGEELVSIPQLPLADLASASFSANWGSPGSLQFCLQADQLILVPKQNASGYSVRLRYIRRLNRLTLVENCGKVTTVTADNPAPGRTLFTLDTVPTAFSTASTKYDFVQEVPNFDIWSESVSLANVVSGAAGTFDVDADSIPDQYTEALAAAASTDGAMIQTGYWCPEQSTCVVPIPDVLHPLLVGLGAAQVLRTLGDFQGSAIEAENAQKKMTRLAATFEPRTRARGMKIMSDSHPLRANRNRGWWG